MTRAASAAALLPLLVSLALLGGACATAEERAGADSATGETSAPPAEPSEPAPTTTEPAATPPTTDPPPPPPELAATTRAAEEPAPAPAAEDPEPVPTVTEAAPPEPIHPPETTPTSEEPAPPPATELPDEDALTATDSLPGEPYEWGPAEGTLLRVVGVPQLPLHHVPSGQITATLDISNPYESLLEVREAPSGEFIASIDSPTGGIVATGRTRRLPGTEWPEAVWDEVRVAGLTGWARAAHLAPTGLTDDVTAHLIDLLGERPVADTLIDLALIVGEAMATEEPRSLVHTVTRPIVFEGLGEVTVDVLNIGDDSLAGFRLHVFATPAAKDWMSEDPGPFTLRTVERTIICHSHRGVTADGLCT